MILKTLPQFQCDPNTQFTCKTGTCISREKRCDQHKDCKNEYGDVDGFDEKNCAVTEVNEKQYRSSYPPVDSGQKLKINVSFVAIEVMDLR